MNRIHEKSRALAALMLAGAVLLLPATAPALTTVEEDFVCPLDGSTSRRTVVMSYTVVDTRLDFRPVGALMSPPPIAVCRSNGFVLYQEDFTEDQLVQLRAIVASDEYKSLRAGNGDWFMAGYLAERMGMTRGAISKLSDRLVAKGLVARRADADDRRAQALALTGPGRLTLCAAVAADPDAILGSAYAATHDGLGRLAKIFDYGARLTEFVLLGTLASRTGKIIKWDAEGMKCTNAPEAQPFIEGSYRKGWELPV